MKIIIVMPVANEEATMQKILDDLLNLPYDNLYVYPVLDAYSKDRTEEIIREYESKTKRVKEIFYAESSGVVSCYLYGFKKALEDGADYVIEMDGGGSHQPFQVPQFINALDEGYECVFGSRFCLGGELENDPLIRRFLSKGGTILSNMVLGTRLSDMTSGFEAFKKEVLLRFDLEKFISKGHIYQTEMRYYCRNTKYAVVPIKYVGSSSGLKMKSVVDALKILFKIKNNEKIVIKSL